MQSGPKSPDPFPPSVTYWKQLVLRNGKGVTCETILHEEPQPNGQMSCPWAQVPLSPLLFFNFFNLLSLSSSSCQFSWFCSFVPYLPFPNCSPPCLLVFFFSISCSLTPPGSFNIWFQQSFTKFPEPLCMYLLLLKPIWKIRSGHLHWDNWGKMSHQSNFSGK